MGVTPQTEPPPPSSNSSRDKLEHGARVPGFRGTAMGPILYKTIITPYLTIPRLPALNPDPSASGRFAASGLSTHYNLPSSIASFFGAFGLHGTPRYSLTYENHKITSITICRIQITTGHPPTPPPPSGSASHSFTSFTIIGTRTLRYSRNSR